MDNLTQFHQDGLEIFIDTQSGESFASQRGLARMCNKGESTVRAWRTAQNIETKEAQIPTSTGLKTVLLYDEETILEALAKYNPQRLKQCAQAGIRVLMHKLAGYEVQSTASTQSKKPSLEEFAADAKLAMQVAKTFNNESHKNVEIALKLIQDKNPNASEWLDTIRQSFNSQQPDSDDWLQLILDCAVPGESISARDIQQNSRKFRKITANQIREYFKELAYQGYGEVSGTGSRLRFCKFHDNVTKFPAQ